jgi:PAS domain S-box-containing protein
MHDIAPEHILVVDDNVDAAELISVMLQEHGFLVTQRHSGGEALSLLASQSFDLVILDVMLPDASGLMVAEQIKKRVSAECFLPIIMISALSNEYDKENGLVYADDYLTKPFSVVELLARIQSQLRNRRMHSALAQSQRMYQYLYDRAPHLYVSLDRRRIITNCNDSFCETIGLPKSEIIGQHILTFFTAENHDLVNRYLDSGDDGRTGGLETVLTLSIPGYPAEQRLVAVGALYRIQDERECSLVLGMQDITQKVKLEEQQKMARRQLYRSARLASIGTLASGVAHEINNPLTAILGFASSLLSRAQQGEEIEHDELVEYLQIITNETLRCRGIIENLSNFAREREVCIHDVSLKEVVDTAIKLLSSRIAKSGCVLSTAIQQDVLVRADSNKLSQVLVNVITNALDFSSPGAIISLSMQTNRAQKRVSVIVADTGHGIAPQILPKVFDPFFTTKEVGKGTGLGLATCHAIMEECSGSIDISSELGKGTRVVLEVPCATDAHEPQNRIDA